MVEIVDIPIQVGRTPRKTYAGWALLTFALIIMVSLSWGMGYIHVGEVMGLDIQVEFIGHNKINQKGEFIYQMESPLAYRIRVKNRSHLDFSKVEVQASLHSDGVTCHGENLFPGVQLPGNSKSPNHSFPVPAYEDHLVESIYKAPDSLCPSSGNLQIHLNYQRQGRSKATTFIAPVHFSFE